MNKFFLEVPLIKSKILVELSNLEYRKKREPETSDYFIHIKTIHKNIDLEVIRNIEDIIFYLYKKKDKKEPENKEFKYKAFYKKHNTYIRQEKRLLLHINNSILIFEELYYLLISLYEKRLNIKETKEEEQNLTKNAIDVPIEEESDIEVEELSLDFEPDLFEQYNHNIKLEKTENENFKKFEDKKEVDTNIDKEEEEEEEEYDASFLFDKDNSLSLDKLKETVGIQQEEEFDSDSDIPDFPMQEPKKENKSAKSRFSSEPIKISKETENGEFLLEGLLDQAGFERKNKNNGEE